jgi:hypothetical protein
MAHPCQLPDGGTRGGHGVRTTFTPVERFASPKGAWENLERHQFKDPKGTYWVRQLVGHAELDWAVVKEIQVPWPAVEYAK